MIRQADVFYRGLIISALGSLPLGVLNITAMQVAMEKGVTLAIFFSLGVALAEIFYVRICLVGVQWLRRHDHLLKWLDLVSLLVVLLLAAGSFIAAVKPGAEASFVLQTDLPFFILGLLMSALNPVQIPFWIGWSSFLFSRKKLVARNDIYNWFICGVGSGTMAGLMLFIFGGRFFVSVLRANQAIMNGCIGAIFLVTALIQLFKIYRHRGLSERTSEKVLLLEAAEQEAS